MAFRWPWVRYDEYATIVALATAANDECRGLLQQLESRNVMYQDLLEKYHALATFTSPAEIATTSRPVQQIEPSFVAQIIRDQSKADPRLAAYLKTYATQLKADGMTEDEIGMALTQWSTTEPQ